MRMLAIPFVAAGLMFGLAGIGQTQTQDELRAVIDRAIKEHGGEEVLKKIQGGRTKNKGKIEILNGVEFSQQTAFKVPDKFRDEMELEVMGQKVKVVTIFDGTNGSIEVNGQKIPVNDAIKDALKQAGEMLRLMRLVGLEASELSALGEARVNDQAAVGVRISRKHHRDVNVFFEKKSGLMTKVEMRMLDPMTGQEVTEERVILEYQKSGGIPTAKRVVVNRDGKRYLEAEVLEVKLLDTIDDAEFAIP